MENTKPRNERRDCLIGLLIVQQPIIASVKKKKKIAVSAAYSIGHRILPVYQPVTVTEFGTLDIARAQAMVAHRYCTAVRHLPQRI